MALLAEDGDFDWDQLRHDFICSIAQLGNLTDRTSSLPNDCQFDHLTKPAWNRLNELEKHFRLLAPSDETTWPVWFQSALEEFEMEGGSPGQMQKGVLRLLERG